MIESELKASCIIQELEKISSDLERLSHFLISEDKNLSEILYKVLSFILLNLENPIFEDYPSLRPGVMAGEKYKEHTFKLNDPLSELNRRNQIESRMKAAFVVKELERISSDMEQLERRMINEDKKSAELLCKILSVFLFDIEGPIIRDHPSLRPAVMLGKKHKNSTYKVIKYDKNSGSSSTVKSGIPPADSARVLTEIETESSRDENTFFGLALEGY